MQSLELLSPKAEILLNNVNLRQIIEQELLTEIN